MYIVESMKVKKAKNILLWKWIWPSGTTEQVLGYLEGTAFWDPLFRGTSSFWGWRGHGPFSSKLRAPPKTCSCFSGSRVKSFLRLRGMIAFWEQVKINTSCSFLMKHPQKSWQFLRLIHHRGMVGVIGEGGWGMVWKQQTEREWGGKWGAAPWEGSGHIHVPTKAGQFESC